MDDWLKAFLVELEQLGPYQVRDRLVKAVYSDAQRREVAFAWLRQKDQARHAELDRRRAEREAAAQLARALTAAERVTEEANRLARSAQKVRTKVAIALMIALTALMISTLSLLPHVCSSGLSSTETESPYLKIFTEFAQALCPARAD